MIFGVDSWALFSVHLELNASFRRVGRPQIITTVVAEPLGAWNSFDPLAKLEPSNGRDSCAWKIGESPYLILGRNYEKRQYKRKLESLHRDS